MEHGAHPQEFFVEITCAVHHNDYYRRVLVDTDGWSFGPRNITKDKTKKTYPENTFLIVYCTFERLVFPTEWAVIIDDLKANPMPPAFREITIIESRQHYTANI